MPPHRITRLSTGSWIVYDLANTIFSFNIISAFYPVWLNQDLGLIDSVFAIGNAVSMGIVFLLAPFLGALSDRARRRIPFLVASTVLCVLTTAPLGFVGWQASILLYVVANAGFQGGLVFYDALLSVVSVRKNRGRVGSWGVAIGYLGSLLGLGLGRLVLGADKSLDRYVFLATALAFLVLALPAFLFVREPPRSGSVHWRTLLPAARASFTALWRLARGREDRAISRFLLGRVFYTDATNTLVFFMAVYAINEVGYTEESVQGVLLAGILGAFALSPLFGALVDRIGAKHTLDLVLLTWMFGLLVVVLIPVLDLPQVVFIPTAFLLGGALGGTWSSDRPLMLALAPPARLGEFYGMYGMMSRFSAILGPLVWALIVDGLEWGRPAAVASLFVFLVVGFLILRLLPDPDHPGPSRLTRLLPWRDEQGERIPLPPHAWARAPAHVVYALGTTLLFWLFAILYGRDGANVPRGVFAFFVYEIPALFADAPRTLLNFATAVWANYHHVQLVYVFVLLALFGVWFEIREGSKRAILVFYASSIAAGLVAGILLHVIRLELDGAWIERAWAQPWTGGSAGAFGLMGAYAARARNPWPLLALFAFWELNVGLWYLKSYTPAFHFTALATGFLITRYALPPPSPSPAPRAARPQARVRAR